MSLEAQITELTAAVNKLSTITQALHDLRADAIEKTTAAAASTSKTTKATEKPKEEKQAISETPENRTDPTAELQAIAADYIGASDREEERAARKEKVKALLNHDKIRAKGIAAGEGKLTNVGDVDLFKAQVAKLKDKGDITEPPKAAASDDLDL